MHCMHLGELCAIKLCVYVCMCARVCSVVKEGWSSGWIP